MILREDEELSDTDSSSEEDMEETMTFRQEEGASIPSDRTKKQRLINDPLIDSSKILQLTEREILNEEDDELFFLDIKLRAGKIS